MGQLIHLYNISSQDEIFCQNYVISIDASFSAYSSGLCQNIKPDEIKYNDLTTRQRNTLCKAGSRLLHRKEIKLRISEISRLEAEYNNSASLEEILNYLTLCVRKSKSNIRDSEESNAKINTSLIRSAIEAINVLIKRYPDFAEGEKKEPIVFNRGV